jgi:5'-3' exonuclease
MLPPHSIQKLISNKKLKSLSEVGGQLADLYPLTFITEYDGVNDDWLNLNIIPFVDPDRVINATKNIRMVLPKGNDITITNRVQDLSTRRRRTTIQRKAKDIQSQPVLII